MASISDDVNLEKLLELRTALQKQINQLNVSDAVVSSSIVQESADQKDTLITEGYNNCSAWNAEKLLNLQTSDKQFNESKDRDLVSDFADKESYSAMTRKSEGRYLEGQSLGCPVEFGSNLASCPFQHNSKQSADMVCMKYAVNNFTSHSEIGESSPTTVMQDGNICDLNAVGAPPNKKIKLDSLVVLSDVSKNGFVEDEERNNNVAQVRNFLTDAANDKKNDPVFSLTLVPPPSPPPTSSLPIPSLPSTLPIPVPPIPPPPPPPVLENRHNIQPSSLSSEMAVTCHDNLIEGQNQLEDIKKVDSLLPGKDEDGDDDIDFLLEKPVEDAQTGKVVLPEDGEMREKIVLAYRGAEYFDVLPEGWVEVTHSSGLPIYLHKSTRVCTFSRPYFIGPGSVRHHNVPICAIPCLHQRRVLKEVEEDAAASAAALKNALSVSADDRRSDDAIEDSLVIARLQAPGTKVQTVKDFKERQLDTKSLHDYAKAIFKFKTIQTYRFNRWAATRSFHRQRKLAEAARLGKNASSIELSVDRPALPSNVKLITVPALEANLKPQHRGFFLNPQGKTSVSVLHEYVQKVLKSTINYYFSETRNSSMPYGCTARLKINLNNRVLCAASVKEKLMLLQEKQKREQLLQEHGEQPGTDFVVLGTGCGNSKKTAKLDAARNALKVLIPDLEFDAEGIALSDKIKDDSDSEKEDAVALFDMLPIEDSRIFDLSARAGQPSPYLLLQECLKRNAAYGDTEVKLHSTRVRHQRHQFQMDVGKHRVSVICANKREGKQKASQAMLKKLHPNLDTWGSLIRLYGNETQQRLQEARKSRQSIIQLQSGNRVKESSAMEPNNAILEKLRTEMLKLSKCKKSEEINEGIVCKRPKLSVTNEPVDGGKCAQESAGYATKHPDALSALRIDL
ncbi:unnamed protein product [Thelazia callipaeda]|uniref:WW domain-containing protein n=1 Tax=Thelazia callipaeda TaxID=103827 RepID=A0A0N5CNU2_THECL|nr:unnamed protein product [Thelazia callipaeda]